MAGKHFTNSATHLAWFACSLFLSLQLRVCGDQCLSFHEVGPEDQTRVFRLVCVSRAIPFACLLVFVPGSHCAAQTACECLGSHSASTSASWAAGTRVFHHSQLQARACASAPLGLCSLFVSEMSSVGPQQQYTLDSALWSHQFLQEAFLASPM